MSKVSIIVPMYNSEKYIKRCIDSVLNQKYKNFEIIVINDGSTDNSLKICEEYCDSRLKIFSKKNEGVGIARNYGLDIADGDYILFIDSDDCIDNDYLSRLVECNNIYNADLIESGARVHFENDYCIYPYQKENQITMFDNKEYIKNFLLFKTNISVWGKLYKRELIGKTRFKKMNINEDFFFTWEIVKKTGLYVENLNTNYNYYLDKPNSLSRAPFSHENMSLMSYINQIINDVEKIFPEYKNEAISHYSACLLHNYFLYYDYLKSSGSDELYVDLDNQMNEASKKSGEIKGYLLLSEADTTIIDMKDKINKILERRKNDI